MHQERPSALIAVVITVNLEDKCASNALGTWSEPENLALLTPCPGGLL